MKSKVFIVVIIMVFLLPLLWAQSTEDFEVSQNADNTLTITGYKGTMQDLEIPDTIYGLRVTAIGYQAFKNKKIKSVVIPDTIIEIGRYAFAHDSHPAKASESILEMVTLGKNVKKIDTCAFEENPGLIEIVIPDSVTLIDTGAFSSCGLTNVQFGKGLEEIGHNAFYGNKIQSLIIPNGVSVVYNGAFNHNPLSEIVIPASLSSLNQVNRNKFQRGPTGAMRRIFSSAFNFIDNNLSTHTRVTLPANMEDLNMNEVFEQSLINFYISQNKAAGIYVKNGPIWTRQ
jgi:hypothetical protein